MNRIIAALLIGSIFGGIGLAQSEDEDFTHPVFKRLLSTPEPEEPHVLAAELDDQLREWIAFGLLRRRKLVRDSVLTLACIEGKQGFSTETEEVFESLGPNTRDAVVPVLIDWLRGDNAFLRKQANSALYHIDAVPASVVPVLREMTKGKSESNRQRACQLLGRVGLAAKPAVSDLRRCMQDGHSTVQLAAAEAMAIVDHTDLSCVDVLAKLSRSNNSSRAQDAVEALGRTGTRALKRPEVLRAALDSGFKAVRRNATYVLHDLGSDAVPLLAEWLSDENASGRLRGEIAGLVVWMDCDLASLREPMKKLAQASDGELQVAAIKAMQTVGDLDATALAAYVNGAANLRKTVASALGESSTDTRPAAERLLHALAKDRLSGIRLAAIGSLWRLGVVDTNTLTTIREVLRTGKPTEKVQPWRRWN